jgi:Mrp family chromosome partitioning ATPase
VRKVSVATTVMPGYDHVSGLERLRGPVTVVRRCESLAELISVARAGLADVVLVAGDTSQLTLTFLESLESGGPGGRAGAVVALSEVAEERDRIAGLGIPVASPEVEPADLAALLTEAAQQARSGPAAGRPRPTPGGPSPVPATAEAAGSARRRAGSTGPGERPVAPPTAPHGQAPAVDDSLPAAPHRAEHDTDPGGEPRGEAPTVHEGAAHRGADPEAGPDDIPAPPEDAPPSRVTAVWGPAGSPGRTTVAVNLAVELAVRGRRTLLVDLDTYAAAVGIHLGLLDESAGIAQACRLADQDGITPGGVERSAVRARVAGTTLQVLTGLTRADRWPEVRRAALDAVLEAAAEGWDEVVVDCGFCLEEDEELSFDIPAPQRNAATLAGLAAADRILAVGTGDAVGLPRLIRGLDELDRHVEASGGTSVEVLVNQVRAEASGVAPQSQIRSVVERFGGSWEVAAFLPWDRKALDRALLGGQVLAEAAPKSALRKALARLADTSGTEAAGGPGPRAGTGVPRRGRRSVALASS